MHVCVCYVYVYVYLHTVLVSFRSARQVITKPTIYSSNRIPMISKTTQPPPTLAAKFAKISSKLIVFGGIKISVLIDPKKLLLNPTVPFSS